MLLVVSFLTILMGFLLVRNSRLPRRLWESGMPSFPIPESVGQITLIDTTKRLSARDYQNALYLPRVNSSTPRKVGSGENTGSSTESGTSTEIIRGEWTPQGYLLSRIGVPQLLVIITPMPESDILRTRTASSLDLTPVALLTATRILLLMGLAINLNLPWVPESYYMEYPISSL